ncbi:MAG: tetratricopeptide repeat protein [Parachlamydia sp.]|nr:tetratricopeptide repeat protein [Parachlamydia sp.]
MGKQGYVELIGTPEELAKLQSERFYQEDVILSNVLRIADIIDGDESLYQQYIQAVQTQLEIIAPKSTLSIGQERSIKLLRDHLDQYAPCMDRKEENPTFNIKIELYRPLSFLIACIAEYYEIEEQNTWKRLNMLANRNILSKDAGQHLQAALAKAMNLRIRCHLHYRQECDEVYHSSMQFKGRREELQNMFVLTDTDIDNIIKIYQVLFPLHRICKQVCLAGKFDDLSKETFRDMTLKAQGEAHEKLHQYSAAKKCYQDALALNPADPEAQLKLAELFMQLADYTKANDYAIKAFVLASEQNNEKVLAQACNLRGLICQILGDLKNAIQYFEEALRINKKVYGDSNPTLVNNLINIGNALQILGEPARAIMYYYQALMIIKVSSNKNGYAECLSNTGCAYEKLGNAKEAVKLFEQALSFLKRVYHNEHQDVAACLINLGRAWCLLEDPKKAIGYLEEALRIQKKIYRDEHPDVASCLCNLGNAWEEYGDVKKAIALYEEALRMDMKVFHKDHPDVASCYNLLGIAWHKSGEDQKACAYLEQSYRIRKQAYGEEHPSIGTTLNNLGNVWNSLGNGEKAIGYYTEALRIDKKNLGDDHPTLVTTLANLGNAWLELKDNKKAIEYFEEALRINKQVHGDAHRTNAIILHYLGKIWIKLKDAQKAIVYLEESYQIGKMVLDGHPGLALINTDLHHARRACKEAKQQRAKAQNDGTEETHLLGKSEEINDSNSCCCTLM